MELSSYEQEGAGEALGDIQKLESSIYKGLLKPAKSEEVIQSIIDSKKFRPYLNKMFGI